MKKLLFAISIAMVSLFAASCKQKDKTGADQNDSQATVVAAAKTAALTSKNYYTLNGISFNSADAMVNSFLADTGSFGINFHTCVWFSKAAFQQMYNILSKDTGSDGIRFYFARTIPDGRYTVVAVATTDGGVDTTDHTGQRHIHNDYFQHLKPVLTGTDVFGQLGAISYRDGALLHNPAGSPCPANTPPCPQTIHYISCDTAYMMVNPKTTDPINATSEWFDKGIINDLITATPANGGIRLYFAKHLAPVAPDTIARHGFVLIVTVKDPSSDIQVDTYNCIGLHPFYKHPLFGGGATDNGEQCPTNCQGTTWP